MNSKLSTSGSFQNWDGERMQLYILNFKSREKIPYNDVNNPQFFLQGPKVYKFWFFKNYSLEPILRGGLQYDWSNMTPFLSNITSHLNARQIS